MRKRQRLILAGILGAAFLMIGPAMRAEWFVKVVPTPQERPRTQTFNGRIGQLSKVPEDDVNKAMQALGPVMREELSKGNSVTLAGIGTFRIVKLPEYRDLKDGKPVVIPARNTVEFIPDDGMRGAANSDNAIPAVVVPAFEYNAMPGQTPGQKMGRTRVGDVRVP